MRSAFIFPILGTLLFLALDTIALPTFPSLSLVQHRHSATRSSRPLAWLKHTQQHTPCTPSSTLISSPSSPSWFRAHVLPHRRLMPAYGAAGRGRRGQQYGGRGGHRGGRGGMGGGTGEGGVNLNSWTNRLLALNVAIFFLQQVNPGITLMGAKNDKLIRRGELHRLFTPMLLHGDLQHLMANSYTMYNLGHFIEPLFGGSKAYLSLYVLSGVAGNYLSFASGRAPISIGASTAVSGLLGAVGLFCYRHRMVWNLEGPLRSVAQAVVINGVLGMSSSRIDNFGHLGGLVGGVVCGWLFGPRLVPLHTKEGQFRGYVNSPILQTGLAEVGRKVRGRLARGKGGRQGGQLGQQQKQGWGGVTRQQQLQQQQQQQQHARHGWSKKAPTWWQRLGAFLHRGGEEGGREDGSGGGRLAFVGAPGSGGWVRRSSSSRVLRSGRGRGCCWSSEGGRGGGRRPYTTGLSLEVMMGGRGGGRARGG